MLDATEALGAHLDAIVLVGAQAIYLHTGAADLAVYVRFSPRQPFVTDDNLH